jgi:hypothetical protein
MKFRTYSKKKKNGTFGRHFAKIKWYSKGLKKI